MIKIAVFDLDGTLVNSLTDLALNVNKGLKKAGLPEQPIENYKKFVGNGRERMIKRAMGDHADDIAALDDRITALETASGTQADTLASIQQTLETMQAAITKLQNSLTYPKS